MNSIFKKNCELQDTSRRIFAQFDTHHKLWEDAVGCLAVIDVLCALAAFSRAADQVACRPKIMAGGQPYLRMVEGIHPCHSQLFVSTEFIPNDVYLGCQADGTPSNDSLKLVTGPNMGGKSTLMRQVLPTGGIVKSSIDFLDVVLFFFRERQLLFLLFRSVGQLI